MKVQIVEGLLRAGVAWGVIEVVVGLTEAGFQALKAEVASSNS